jgi:uncharacterized protein YuzE
MKITFDPKYNIAYISFKEKTEAVNSLKLSEDVIVDISPDGSIYGIELLNANAQINDIENGNLHLINQLSGKSTKMEFI